MLELDKEALIRDRAYAIWEANGRPIGRDQDHWYQAAKEITDQAIEAANPVKRVRRTLRSAGTAAVRRKK
jgi:hypothetical protein